MQSDQANPKARDVAEIEARTRLDARWLLGDPSGRRFVALLLEQTRIEEAVLPLTVEGLQFHTGKRFVGWWVRDWLQRHDPEGWIAFESERLFAARDAAIREQLELRAVAEAAEADESPPKSREP